MRYNGQTKRNTFRGKSNNPENNNKNICTLAVTEYLHVAETVRYLHTYKDVLRAIRTRYYSHSRLSILGKGKTVGAIRKYITKLTEGEGNIIGFFVHVDRHVLFLDGKGKTVVDTDSREKDKRKVLALYIVKTLER